MYLFSLLSGFNRIRSYFLLTKTKTYFRSGLESTETETDSVTHDDEITTGRRKEGRKSSCVCI